MDLNNFRPIPMRGTPPRNPRDHERAHRWTPSDGGAVITVFVILAVAVAMSLPSHSRSGLARFSPEHVALLDMVDTAAQRLALRVGLALLAALCLLGAVAITHPAALPQFVTQVLRIAGKFLRKWCGVFLVAAAALVPLFDLQGTVFPGPAGRKLLLSFWLISSGTCVLGLLRTQYRKTRLFLVIVWSCIIAYGLFLVVPGFTRVPFLFEPLQSGAEWHYSVTLAQADRLASGLRLGSQVHLNYGLIHSLVIAVFERRFGFLDFGEHFRLVQAFQAAFLLVAIVACHLWRPGNPMFVLFGALLIGPWVSTSHLAVYYPNQSGWRSLGLAVGVAVLLMCRRQTLERAALILGASASFLLLYNPETGLCLLCGYGLFLLSRQRSLTLTHLSGLALRAAGGAVIVFLAVILLYRVGLEAWPPFTVAPFIGFIQRFGQGYGGLRLFLDPLALLIFVHSAYSASSLTLEWRTRELRFDESVRLGISAMILVWSAYYVNRPHAWTLWTFQFLYLFLIADIFERRLFRGLRRRGITAAVFDPRLAAFTFVLVPVLLFSNYSILLFTLYPAKPTATNAVVSGVSMSQASADALLLRANLLASQKDSSILYFSHHSYSLSLLSRRFNPLPVQDAFPETITNSDFETLLAEIYRLSPRVILFDEPDSRTDAENPFISFYAHFFDRLKIRLAERYRQGPIKNGWQIWELRSPEIDRGVVRGTASEVDRK